MKFHWVFLIILIASSCQKKKDSLLDVLVYGHAGTSLHPDKSHFTPNSFESIQYAVEVLDAEGIEVDIQMTKDSVLVLFHDYFLASQTHLDGCIIDYTYQELKAAKFGNSKKGILSLSDFFDYIYPFKTKIYLDIKTSSPCQNETINSETFQLALDKSLEKHPEQFKDRIILGFQNPAFMNEINFSQKCLESGNLNQIKNTVNSDSIEFVLINLKNIDEEKIAYFKDNQIKFGIFGIKSTYEIKRAVDFLPHFIITENIAYSKKITK